jgi:protein-L-isoaspartate(D-aspartate) O-methyltransferase
MVDRQIRRRGVSDERVLQAMSLVPRHEFVPDSQTSAAYADCALPIGFGATISQPYIVGLMTEALRAEAGCRILEVGTGSGYQAAVLAACGSDVFSIERVPELHARAGRALRETGFGRVTLRLGDGSR